MPIEGVLGKWNDDRGFGFITPTAGGPEIFVHISAFPKDNRRPTVGERLIFEVEIDRAGKKRAKNLVYPNRFRVQQSIAHRRDKKPASPGRVISLVIIAALAFYGYNQYARYVAAQQSAAAQGDNPSTFSPYRSADSEQSTTSSFRCDGRTYCSQMTSCAEATFFLRNCPNTQMDGNNDGIPCEQQWCTRLFTK